MQPASVDIQLGNEIMMYRTWHLFDQYAKRDLPPLSPHVEMNLDEEMVHQVLQPGESFLLEPGEFILASTLQYVSLAPDIQAQVNGKSSLGRMGLVVHATAGFVDPGFSGHLTLEMTNLNQRVLALEPGMRIAQLSFTRMTASAKYPYGHEKLGSHYQNQTGVTAPRALAMSYSTDGNEAQSQCDCISP